MKKLQLLLIISVLVVLFLVACSENNLDHSSNNATYVDVQNLKTIEEKIIMASLMANLMLESWDSVDNLPSDRFFEYYEALVIIGEEEKLENVEYVPETIVENTILKHFDVSVDYIRTSSYYNKDQSGYFVGGLGNVLDIKIANISEIDQISIIDYETYFNDEMQKQGKMSIRITKDNYKFVSNRIIID